MNTLLHEADIAKVQDGSAMRMYTQTRLYDRRSPLDSPNLAESLAYPGINAAIVCSFSWPVKGMPMDAWKL